MEDLKVVGWVDFDSNYPCIICSGEELMKIIYIVKNEIREKGYFFAGEDHQNRSNGLPILSNGTCFRCTMRLWGKIMAEAHSTEDNKYSYMDFYMSLGSNAVMPKDEYVDLEPLRVEQQAIGYYTPEDAQMINQSISLNMDFMTTDIVLERIYEMVKQNLKN